jgi:amino acid adenylation domain-containing protein
MSPMHPTDASARASGVALTEPSDRARDPLPGQQALWFLHHLTGAGGRYNESQAFALSGAVDERALRGALEALIQRHEALRTALRNDQGRCVAWVEESAPLDFEVVAVGSLDDPGLRAVLAGRAREPFDLTHPAPPRVTLFTEAEVDGRGRTRHVLQIVHHLAVMDAPPTGTFLRELSYAYGRLAEGAPLSWVEHPRVDRYGTRLRPLEEPRRAVCVDYWRRVLEAAPPMHGLPQRLRLPATKSTGSPAVADALDGGCGFSLEPLTVERLRAIACDEDTTLSAMFLAAFQVVIARWSGGPDVVVGIPASIWTDAVTPPPLGPFENPVAVRTHVDADATFRHLLRQSDRNTRGALAHSDLPFEALVQELGLSGALDDPVFQIFFRCSEEVTGVHDFELAGVDVVPLPAGPRESRYHLDVVISTEPTSGGRRATVDLAFDDKLFDVTTIAKVAQHYRRTLEAIAQEPDLEVGVIPLQGASDRRRQIEEWNDTTRDFPRDRTLGELFEETVERFPTNIAVSHEGDSLSYSRLHHLATRVADRLKGAGLRPGEVVVVDGEHTIETVVALVAVALAGGASFAADPGLPDDRLRALVTDSRARFIVSATRLTRRIADDALVTFDPMASSVETGARTRPPLDPRGARAPGSAAPRQVRATALDPAHLVYTSGSTGQPKGILVPHRAVARLVRRGDALQITPGEVIAQIASMSFDASIYEVWSALLNGARLEMVPREAVLEPRRLVAFLREHAVTTILLTPSHFRAVVREIPDALRTLGNVLVGAEVVDPHAVARALEHGPPRRLAHVYGPTEAGTFCCYSIIENPPQGAADLPIGRPGPNDRLYVVDPQGRLCPPGIPGELCIAGDGLASGYWQKPELTAGRFVANPFEKTGDSGEPSLMFKSGDRVVQGDDGNLFFLSRLDDQIKLHGHRIEPGEIEALLIEIQAVTAAAARVWGEGSRKFLVGYVCVERAPQASATPTTDQMLAFLRERLPTSMMPRSIIVVDDLPMKPSGKIDRSRLPAPGSQRELSTALPAADAGIGTNGAPGSNRARSASLARVLADCFTAVLSVDVVDPDADFFDLGGSSLLTMELLFLVEERLGIRVSTVTFMRHASVTALALHIEASMTNEDELLEGGGSLPSTSEGPLETLARVVRSWAGERAHPEGMVIGHNTAGHHLPLFWCLQGEAELTALAGALGADYPVHGMRSGHETLERNEDLVPALARHYATEIRRVRPVGPYLVGGNCQAAEIAFDIAWELLRAGEQVELLVLMEESVNRPYPGRVALLFGEESFLNPFLSSATDPLPAFKANFRNFSVDIIPGEHGHFFRPENVGGLASILERHIDDIERRLSKSGDELDAAGVAREQPSTAAATGTPTWLGAVGFSRDLVRGAPLGISPSLGEAPLPPGDLDRLDHAEHADRLFLHRRFEELGPIFKAALSNDRLVVGVLGLPACRRLLEEHDDDIGPDSISIERMVPKGFLRQMEGSDHATYRARLVSALRACDLGQLDPELRAILDRGLRGLSRSRASQPNDPQLLLTTLDGIASSTLIRLFFGAPPDAPLHASLLRAFHRLGPEGFVWAIGLPQERAFADLRQQLVEFLAESVVHDSSSAGVLQHAVRQGALDDTLLGNLIYLVEMGRFDLAGLFRWLVAHAARHPALLQRIRVEERVAAGQASSASSLAEAFVLETLRMDQSERLMRVAKRDFVFDGYRIPEGSVVRLCLWESHKLSTSFGDPFTFDPDRFLGTDYTSDEFAPFGLGRRHCPVAGFAVHLATLLVQTIANLGTLDLLSDGPPIHGAYHWEPSERLAVSLREQ